MTLTYQEPSCEIHQGHVLDVLAEMPAESVDCCITSPPYWALRKYTGEQVVKWADGSKAALGLEPTPELYLSHLLDIFRAVRRVLRPWGTCWVNIGDSYAANRSYQVPDSKWQDVGNSMSSKVPNGLKPLDLYGIPESLVLALRADGWYWRSTIIWAKTNPMPESIRGWYFTRHRVTIEEYEKLSSLWTTKGRDKDRASNLSRMSAGQISDCEEAISTIGKGQKDSQAARGTGGCPREEEIILSIRKRTGQSSEIQRHPEGQDNSPSYNSALSSKEDTGRPRDDDQRLVRDSEAAQVPMFLLQEEGCSSDNGPRDTTGQGRIAYQGEYSSCLPQLQRSETGQNRDALIDCPGCPTCLPNDGLVLRKGSWRPTSSFEYLFMLAKSKDYFCDGEAVRESLTTNEKRTNRIVYNGKSESTSTFLPPNPNGRNLRDVWTINTQPFPGAHFATFPEELVKKPILASTSDKGNCPKCGMPWVRVIKRISEGKSYAVVKSQQKREQGLATAFSGYSDGSSCPEFQTLSWRPSCSCGITEAIPAIILDPFCGSGTTLAVAKRLGRRAIGIDLSGDYCQMAQRRVEQETVPFKEP